MQYTMVITDKGNCPHLRCTHSDMFLPWASLNIHQPGTALCVKGDECKRRLLAADESWEGS